MSHFKQLFQLASTAGSVGAVLGEGGVTLGGVRLNLTDFTVIASNTNTLSPIPTVPAITFEHNFTYSFTGRRSTPTKLTAFTNLGGEWRSNNLMQNVNRGDEITFAASVFTQSNEREILPSLTSRKPPAAAIRADLEPTPASPAPKDLDNKGSRLNNPRIVGSLVNFKLARGETLCLPNSACVVIPDAEPDEFNFKVKDGCQVTASVPEPSSVLGILALSALGVTSLLTRQQKSLQQNK